MFNCFMTPWTVACQGPLHGIPQEEYWSGLPFPSPGSLPNTEPTSQYVSCIVSFFTIELPGKPIEYIVDLNPNWILRCNILKAEANKSTQLFTEVFLRRVCGKEERSWDLVLLDLAWILLAVVT